MMIPVRRLLAALVLLAASAPVRSQEPPVDPGTTNTLQFEFSVVPTNQAILITQTTNLISVIVSNWMAFTNVTITGLQGTNVIDFIDDGTPPDQQAGNGIFQGELLTPLVFEQSPIDLLLTLIGTDLASVTNEPPADPPLMVTNTARVTYNIVPRPPNDPFTNAFKLLSAGGLSFGTNQYGSLEPREPVHASVNSRSASIWWTWAAPSDGNVLVDLAGTEFSAILSVFRGDRVTNLVAVAASTNDVGRGLPPNVVFPATRGTTYRIAVSGIDSNNVGRVRLRVAPGGTPDTRPPVIAIQSPLTDSLVSDPLLVVSGSARESFPLDSGISNILIQVNNQPRTNALGTESWAATVTLPPGTNVIRAFAVDYAGNTSEADSIVVRYLNPTNDYFALSAQLEGTGGFVSSSNEQATKEHGEPLHAGNDGGRSVWYWWRAPAHGELSLTTSGSTVDTLLAVYVGETLADLTEILSNDDALPGSAYSSVRFPVSSNEVYRVVVDAYGGAIGTFGLQYVFTPAQAGTFYNIAVSRGVGGSVSPPGGAFPAGARVTLTAVPQPDFAFVGWEGDVASTENPLTLVASRNLRLTPRFRTVRFTEDFESGDFSRVPWNNAAPSWTVQTNPVAAGFFAARSGPAGHGQSSSLTLVTNTASGTGSFDLRVSSEPGWDFFEFLVDGTVVRRWSGEVPWQTFTFQLSAGDHTFTWRYVKDPNFTAGLDAAFLDNVYLPPPSSTGGGSLRPLLSIHLFPEGAQITVVGEPGVPYELQAAPSVSGPWSHIATQASGSGIINILDLQAVGTDRRFYRATTAGP